MFIHPFSRFSMSLCNVNNRVHGGGGGYHSCIIHCFTTNDCVAMCGLKHPSSRGNPEGDTGSHALDIVGFCPWQFNIPRWNCCPNSECIHQRHYNIKGLLWLSISPYERLISGETRWGGACWTTRIYVKFRVPNLCEVWGLWFWCGESNHLLAKKHQKTV